MAGVRHWAGLKLTSLVTTLPPSWDSRSLAFHVCKWNWPQGLQRQRQRQRQPALGTLVLLRRCSLLSSHCCQAMTKESCLPIKDALDFILGALPGTGSHYCWDSRKPGSQPHRPSLAPVYIRKPVNGAVAWLAHIPLSLARKVTARVALSSRMGTWR